MRPRRARVGRLVDAVAHSQVGALQSFAATDVNYVWVGWCDRDRADRAARLFVENRLPYTTVVRAFPDAAGDVTDVKDVWLFCVAGGRFGASAAKRTDHAPAHVEVLRGNRCREAEEQAEEKNGSFHVRDPSAVA